MNKKAAIIFDMDGLLIDSEPIWREVEVAVFRSLGVPLTIEKSVETMGLRCDEVTAYWYARHPWTGKSLEQVTDEIVRLVIQGIREGGVAMRGALEAVAIAQDTGCRVAIASSSSMEIIKTVVDRFAIKNLDLIYSAENEKRGKPAPDVYLSAARLLGVSPADCVALEDSRNGVLSAKSAGMKCIAVPDFRYSKLENFPSVDLILNSLLELKVDHFISLISD